LDWAICPQFRSNPNRMPRREECRTNRNRHGRRPRVVLAACDDPSLLLR
jgi:hypothetical protein